MSEKSAGGTIDLKAGWQAREDEIRSVTRSWGVLTREQLAGKSGVEMSGR